MEIRQVAPSGISAWLDVNVGIWRLAAFLVCAMVAAPVAVVAASWFQPAGDVWRHLATTVLDDLIINTIVLSVGVGFGAAALGILAAWLTALCEFPGRRFLEGALMFPLAIPAYVTAFVAVGLLDWSGSVQTVLRAWTGSRLEWFPSIRSTGGTITVMTLCFFPYVYMLAREAFRAQGRLMLEQGRVLGLRPWAAFFRVALPCARPAVAAGVALAVMEALADFGAVSILGVDTFTTAIYKSWQGLFSLEAAAQLASLLLAFVAVALVAEQRMRLRARFHTAHRPRHEERYRLTGWHAVAATGTLGALFAFAFVIPVMQLLVWAARSLEWLDARYFGFVTNTVVLGAMAAMTTVVAALTLAWTARLKPDARIRAAVRGATLGYALPGSILAVGIVMSFAWIDREVVSRVQTAIGQAPAPVLVGSVIALILAYGVRFLAVAFGPIDSALERIRPAILQAARSLGAGNLEILRRISIPILRGSLLTAAALVFVEVMKEMPATLLLRPFGWDTLATRIFELVSEGQWEPAAIPAVALVLVGILPVLALAHSSRRA